MTPLRSWLSLAVLLLVVAALGAWIHYQPAEPARAGYALSELKRGDVTRIRIERPARGASPPSAIALERNDDRWRLTAPVSARAGAAQVERILTLLDAQSVARYPAQDLARYGLDAPLARVTLNDRTFGLGAVNETTREQYVLAQDHVYAIPLALRTSVPRDADALIARDLFAPGEKPVRLELPEFTAAVDGGAWVFTGAGEDAGPDERNAWARAWSEATAVAAARHDGREPLERLTVTLDGGRTIALGVIQREPELVLLRPDEGIQYHFLSGMAKRLLAAPGTPAQP